ncbi:6-pyruvoyltetrahydropterin/6-carboxytetrahydropterin synthase [Parafrankia irregularis]|uniref:6-carboxy-5,6,7,8-tetrahydropterin synthase n=1 Tax=Parafrankia irregularis TaxID=795642 RepID=A0A0S4QZW8_9ACTN|nr:MULTISPECIES: 6-carboxytetrahydropterin synthase [Parafrankia]MBE3206704.1 6-carboxytetrahydropterin synthase [Parafrankia sp. CH37]CUU60995.1 6-pyruvoyltetrahydropterin/6-carboxytetrahydropterin synthase [Parafrankia irregularis]
MASQIQVGGDRFVFSAAHAALHDGHLEPLHGHSYVPTVLLSGEVDTAGIVVDFGIVEKALGAVVARLHCRTLLAENAPGVDVAVSGAEVNMCCGPDRYRFPRSAVVLLPIVNTTTEALASWILSEVVGLVGHRPGLIAGVELAETSGLRATVRQEP